MEVDVANAKLKQTTCAYCGVGCGVDISIDNGEASSLTGTPEHPANFGRLCVKGTHLLDTLSTDNRLAEPQINNHVVSWDEATNYIAEQFSRIVAQHGADAIAFYVSGQLLTEDYYIANKLMKGYLGSANIDTNSRLCMSSAVAGYKRAFGEDVVPCSYEDLEQTSLLILQGSNAAWTHPVLFQRIERAKRLNPAMKIVVIDPRRTDSVEIADQFLQLKPGTDAALYNGLLSYLASNNALDDDFIAQSTTGFDSALEQASAWSISAVAEFCQLSEQALETFYASFANSSSAITFYSMGINQSSSGTDKCNAIINAHLASGKLLKPGSGPFSITGQPNAMGGREVGGLANQLAAHLDIENAEHRSLVQRFWQSPTIAEKAGKKAVDMFADLKSGKIKAVWIMATNPVVSLPNHNEITAALEACELVVVSDCVSKNDTLSYANVKLPSTGWSEKDGTVTNSERRISRQRAVLPKYAQAKHDWEIMCGVAKAMGFRGFDFTKPSDIFTEWAALTTFENNGARQLDLGALATLSAEQYDTMRPLQWPQQTALSAPEQLFANNAFSTDDKKAHFIPITPQLPRQQTTVEYPFVMNSGRIRDHWHTMTRTGEASRLSAHITRPYIEINLADATALALKTDDLITAQSASGEVCAHVNVTDAVRVGECFMPIHWNAQYASSANISQLYQSVTDPISGQPESKHAAVKLTKAQFAQYSQIFINGEFNIDAEFWLKVKSTHCTNYQLAHKEPIDDLLFYCQENSGLVGGWSMYCDGESTHIQCMQKDSLVFVAVFSTVQKSVSLEWIDHLFDTQILSFEQLQALFNAQPDAEFTQGKQVCSCFKVREQPIIAAIETGCNSVEKLGAKLQCGTNCGSCKTQLSQLINKHARRSETAIEISTEL
ncbi:molybdopterin-dependent oxidoreductase [Pseudoalteromonas shioyasakiensis]|uniref:nitrate reductase n=1 Tax=Pseudoalteromonas shioyasakiensis TaxID=1190813 RepID=UPI0021192055|nr:nitrate reductase [Pseudoalteromonas shioyasakiensis]MCQ8878776.1 molybdopterin-dependent oxidoreductase [Pseudoalteromonas shioyasakiensis]